MASGSLGELYTTIGVKTDGLQAGMRRAESILRQSAAKMDQHAKRIQTALDIKTDRFVKGLSQTQSYISRYASAMRDIESRKGMGGRIAEQARQQEAQLQKLASKLPDGVIKDRIQKAIAAATEAGFRLMRHTAERNLSAIESRISRLNRSYGRQDALVGQFGQAATSLRGQELRGDTAGYAQGLARLQELMNRMPTGPLKKRIEEAVSEGLKAGLRPRMGTIDQRLEKAFSISTDRFAAKIQKQNAMVQQYRQLSEELTRSGKQDGPVGDAARRDMERLKQLASRLPKGVLSKRIEQAISEGAKAGSQKMNAHMTSAVSKVMGKLRSMFIMMGGVYLLQRLARHAISLVKHLLDITGQFERLQVTLDTITHGRGMDTFNALNQWAIKMPINTVDAIRGFVQLRSQGIRPTISDLEILVDTASALSIGGKGGVGELYRSIGNYLARMKSTSRVTMEEIRLLGERGVPAAQILQREFGLTVKQMRRLGHESLNVDRTIAALLRGMEQRFGGQAAKMMETYTGMIEILKASWQEWVRVMMNTGPFQAVKLHMQKLIEWLDSEAGKQRLAKWADDIGMGLLSAIKIMSRMFPSFLLAFGKIVATLVDVVNRVASVLPLRDTTSVDKVKSPDAEWWQGSWKKYPEEEMTKAVQTYVSSGDRSGMGAFTEGEWAEVHMSKRTQALVKAREKYDKLWADWEKAKAQNRDAGPAPDSNFSDWVIRSLIPGLEEATNMSEVLAIEIEGMIKTYEGLTQDPKGSIRELIPLEIGTGMETMMAEVASEADTLSESLARLSMSETAFDKWQLNRELSSVRKNLTMAMLSVDSVLKNEEGVYSGVSDSVIASYKELDDQIRQAHRTGDVEEYKRLQEEIFQIMRKMAAQHKVSFLLRLVDDEDSRLSPEHKDRLKELINIRAPEARLVHTLTGFYEELNAEYAQQKDAGAGDDVVKNLKSQRDQASALLSDFLGIEEAMKKVVELMKEQGQGFADADAYESLKNAMIDLKDAVSKGDLLGEILQLGGMEDEAKRLAIETRAAQMRATAGKDGEMLEMVEAWRQAALAGVGDVKKAAGQVTFFSDASSRWQSIQQALGAAGQKKQEGSEFGEGFKRKFMEAADAHVDRLTDLFRSGIETRGGVFGS